MRQKAASAEHGHSGPAIASSQSEHAEPDRSLSASQVAAYSLPAVGGAAISIPISIYMGPFYAEHVGLGLGLLGAVFMIMRLWDMATDLLLGAASDQIPTPWGRRRPWMLLAAPILMVSIGALFMPPTDVTATYVIAWMLALYIGWTLLLVNHSAWAAELTLRYHERSRLLGWREFAGLAGTVLMLAIPVVLDRMQPGGYAPKMQAMAWFLIVVIPIGTLIAVCSLPDKSPRLPALRGAFSVLAIFRRDRLLRRLMLVDVLLTTAGGTVAAVSLFFISYVIGLEEHASLFVMLQYLVSLASIPAWIRVSYAIGKHRAVAAGMLIFASALPLALLVPHGSFAGFLAIAILKGIGYGPIFFGIRAIIADVADADNLRAGASRSGVYYAFVMMTQKLGLALAFGIAYPMLGLLGFDPAEPVASRGIFALRTVYAALPVVLLVIGVSLIWRFPLGRLEQEALREQIHHRDTVRDA